MPPPPPDLLSIMATGKPFVSLNVSGRIAKGAHFKVAPKIFLKKIISVSYV